MTEPTVTWDAALAASRARQEAPIPPMDSETYRNHRDVMHQGAISEDCPVCLTAAIDTPTPWTQRLTVSQNGDYSVILDASGRVVTEVDCFGHDAIARRIVDAVNAFPAALDVAEHITDRLEMGDCGICGCGNGHIPECPVPAFVAAFQGAS